MKPFNKSRKFDRKSSGEKRDFNRSEKKDFSRSSSPRKPAFNRRDSGSRDSGLKLYPTTCDKCGKDCEVPFQPSGDKPVYCRSCFKQNSPDERSGSFDRNRPPQRERFNDRFEPKKASNVSSEDLDKINRKLDKIMRALKIE